MVILLFELFRLMQGMSKFSFLKFSYTYFKEQNEFYCSDFVATILLHQLYKICCAKRFRANSLRQSENVQRYVIDKYLIMPDLLRARNEVDDDQPPPIPKRTTRLITSERQKPYHIE